MRRDSALISKNMQPVLEQLLVLQNRDQKIRTIERELKMAPVEKKEFEERLASAHAAVEAIKHKGREIEVARKSLELDAHVRRDSIAKLKTQQFQTRKNEEFAALGNEVKRYEAEVQGIEDKELELMDETEKLKPQIAEHEKHLAGQKTQVAEQLGDLKAKIQAIEAELQRLTAERATLAAQIDEEVVERYERLFASKGDAAVVPIEHEVCMGCHMKVTTQTAVRVKGRKEIVGCEQCGRILYLEV